MALAEGDMSAGWIYGVVGVTQWVMALLDDRAAQDVWGKDTNALVGLSLGVSTTRGSKSMGLVLSLILMLVYYLLLVGGTRMAGA